MHQTPTTLAAVLFDVGYTLLDERPRLEAAIAWLAATLRAERREPAPDEAELMRRYVARCQAPAGAPSLFVALLEELGFDHATARRIRREMPWDAEPLVAFPDSRACLDRLASAGLRLGVLANQPASAEDDLVRAGLADRLDGIWLSEPIGLSKPDPAFFHLVLKSLGLPPTRVAYVGDRPDNDVAPARRLGMVTARVRLGPHAEQPAEHAEQQPDVDARDLADAADQIAALAGR